MTTAASLYSRYQRLGFFALALAGLFAGWWDTVIHIATIVWRDDTYSHGLLVPPITLWLIWRRVSEGGMPPARLFLPAFVLIMGATLLWMLGRAMEAGVLEHLALVGAVQSLVLLAFGPAVYRQILFPMLFLFLVIPFGGALVGPLQNITAKSVIWALGILGVPYQADGVLIELSSGLYEVARACAGIKFLFTSMVCGVLLCHLALASWWRRAVMLVVAFLVPILANAIRVLSTLLIAEATDQSFAKDVDHVVYGWGFLSVVLLILIGIAYRFSDREDWGNEPVGESQPKQAMPMLGANGLVAVTFAMLLPILSGFWMHQPSEVVQQCKVADVQVPTCDACGFRPLPRFDNVGYVAYEAADAEFLHLYRAGGNRVTVYGALFQPDRPEHRVIQGLEKGLQNDWVVLTGAPTKNTAVNGLPFEETVLWRSERKVLLWRAYFASGSFHAGSLPTKLALGKARLFGGNATAAALIFSVNMDDGIETARERLTKFLSTFSADRFLWSQLNEPEGHAICAE